MTLQILVVGLRSLDSGKTTLASSLIRALRDSGVDTVALKPVGSVEAWQHPEALRWSGEHSIVVTPDAIRLSAASESAEPLDVVEPVAALHAPPDPSRWQWNPSLYEAATSDPNRTAALVRVTMCTANSRASAHLMVGDTLSRAPRSIASRLESLAPRLTPRPVEVSSGELGALLGPRTLEAADSCLRWASARHEAIVVESYSDVAAPTPASLGSDLVIAVAPGLAALLEGGRYSRAVMVRAGSGSLSLITALEAVHLAEPRRTMSLPVLEDPEEGYPRDSLEPILEAVRGLLRS
ncbi:MAG: hypothetical protein GSR80_000872 [Desulfurococcales archaeon]|nr:hypothetical protein [Desulfurococcales archaeon]